MRCTNDSNAHANIRPCAKFWLVFFCPLSKVWVVEHGSGSFHGLYQSLLRTSGSRGITQRDDAMDLIYRFDPFEPILPRRIDGADEAIEALLEGNALFARIVDRLRSEIQGDHDPAPFLVPWDPMTFGVSMVEGSAVRQTPFALVLGCSDARVPVELIFQQCHSEQCGMAFVHMIDRCLVAQRIENAYAADA